VSWLDSLARWSVGGGSAGPRAEPTDAPISVGATTRRIALRTAAGAGVVALAGPSRLLQPSLASAEKVSALEKCVSKNYKAALADLKACTKRPRERYEDLSEGVAKRENALRKIKDPALKARVQQAIDRANAERARVQKEIDFCNALYLEERAVGEEKCRTANPPATGGSGATGTGQQGCENGFQLCGENYCCNLSNAYCQGCNSKLVCCRLDADCCPGES
jgi:hypothetical protein